MRLGDAADDPRDWRQVCRDAAYAQALAEEQRAWQVASVAPVPFNYRWEHVSQVVGIAKQLARATRADAEIVEAAAWLHDVRKGEKRHALMGALAAREILAATNFPPDKIEGVVLAIRQHEGLFRAEDVPPLQPIEAAILWDADKLSKLGAQAVMMRWCSAGAAGMTLADRWRDATNFVDDLLGRTVNSMNTGVAKEMAERRYRDMLTLLRLWLREAREEGVDLQGDDDFEVSFDNPGLPQE